MNYNNIRKKTKEIKISDIAIGGSNKIAIQSMTNTDTCNAKATIEQIKSLQKAGCDIVRITVPNVTAADTIIKIKNSNINIPIVADIHFDYKVALRCAELGIDKIRINPGNIGDESKIREVCNACRKQNIPIRIGVNGGSLEKHILAKYGLPNAQALFESACYHVKLLEKFDFDNIVVSIKSSSVSEMIKANRMFSEKYDYPLHLGVTEAGDVEYGTVKSSIGVGSLLCDGIGDTIRVSLTEDPIKEIDAAKRILSSIEIDGQSSMNIVSCPTCGRTNINLIKLVKEFKCAAEKEGVLNLPLKVALMGCAVNGPGEAREADVGFAGGRGEGIIFSHGKILYKTPENEAVNALIQEIKKYTAKEISK